MTYAELAARLGCQPAAARSRVRVRRGREARAS